MVWVYNKAINNLPNKSNLIENISNKCLQWKTKSGNIKKENKQRGWVYMKDEYEVKNEIESLKKDNKKLKIENVYLKEQLRCINKNCNEILKYFHN